MARMRQNNVPATQGTLKQVAVSRFARLWPILDEPRKPWTALHRKRRLLLRQKEDRMARSRQETAERLEKQRIRQQAYRERLRLERLRTHEDLARALLDLSMTRMSRKGQNA